MENFSSACPESLTSSVRVCLPRAHCQCTGERFILFLMSGWLNLIQIVCFFLHVPSVPAHVSRKCKPLLSPVVTWSEPSSWLSGHHPEVLPTSRAQVPLALHLPASLVEIFLFHLWGKETHFLFIFKTAQPLGRDYLLFLFSASKSFYELIVY